MKKKLRESLESAGYVVGDADDFLDLTEEESRLVDVRLAVSRAVRNARIARNLTQAQAAKVLNTSQPNVSRIEGAASDVSLDLMYRSLFRLGGTAADVHVEPRKSRIKRGPKPAKLSLPVSSVGAGPSPRPAVKAAKTAKEHGMGVRGAKAKKGEAD
jgi:transcriptional regulator with XRE-family HTH domain